MDYLKNLQKSLSTPKVKVEELYEEKILIDWSLDKKFESSTGDFMYKDYLGLLIGFWCS